jgi:hypothetical protein
MLAALRCNLALYEREEIANGVSSEKECLT